MTFLRPVGAVESIKRQSSTILRNGFNGVEGYRVQVGRNSFIEITVDMLETIYNEAIINNAGIYNKRVFQFCYPNLYNQKPCFVQTIGRIFSISGVAMQNGKNYQIL